MKSTSLLLLASLALPPLAAQNDAAIKALAAQGPSAIPKLAEFLTSPIRESRFDAVHAIVEIGTENSLDPLIRATHDPDADMQVRATDGLVNFYVPGYYRDGFGATIRKTADSVRGRFTDTNTSLIAAGVKAREDVVRAAGRLIRMGATVEVRANAARAAGILRGKEALPDVEEGLKSRDALLLKESLAAARKIGDPAINPAIARLLKDPDEKVQMAALEALGVLGARDTAPAVDELLRRTTSAKLRRAALTTLAMYSDPAQRPVFDHYLRDKDPALRGAAAEGIARLRNAADLPMIERLLSQESKTGAKLSLAFAAAMLGRHDFAAGSPLEMLVRQLKSRFWVDTARPFLLELSRDEAVRKSLYPALASASKDEKLGLVWAFTGSGGSDAVPHLRQLALDADPDVAREAARAAEVLKSRGY